MRNMTKTLIQQIEQDIRNYEESIRNAEEALAEAERELEEILAERLAADPTDFPE